MSPSRDDALLRFLHEVCRHVLLGWHVDLVRANDELLSAGFDKPCLIEIAVLEPTEVSDQMARLLSSLCRDLGVRIPTVVEAATLLGTDAVRRFQNREIDSCDLELDLLQINVASDYEAEALPQLWHEVEWRNETGVRGPQDDMVEAACGKSMMALQSLEESLLRTLLAN